VATEIAPSQREANRLRNAILISRSNSEPSRGSESKTRALWSRWLGSVGFYSHLQRSHMSYFCLWESSDWCQWRQHATSGRKESRAMRKGDQFEQ